MAKLRPELKERLVGEGRWEDFSRRRANLVRSGASAADALRDALAEFLPDVELAKPGPRARASSKSYAASRTAESESSVDVPADAWRDRPFRLKDAPQHIVWVIEHLHVLGTAPSDAPSAFAWSLLAMCRRSPVFCESLMEKAVVRMIPAKPPEDDGGGDDDWDGRVEYDILGRLLDGGGS